MMNTFVVADPTKCITCRSCEIACTLSHMEADLVEAGQTEARFQPRLTLVRGPMVAMPIQCRQCEDAPCALACPQKAISHGAYFVEVNQELCNGCKTCLLVCPFGAMDVAPVVDQPGTEETPQKGLKVLVNGVLEDKPPYTAVKCDLCQGRAEGPACVEICPGKAFTIVSEKVIKKNLKERQVNSAMELAKAASLNQEQQPGV
jgi:electron transport protein HydN